MGIAEGMVAIPYENTYGEYSRTYQFLKYYLWTGSCANVTCPSAMTDGAARLLSIQLDCPEEAMDFSRVTLQKAYEHLTSRDPKQAWTSGQWMTERIGGSNVRNLETVAHLSPLLENEREAIDSDENILGPWVLDGFKWFSSATDASMAIILAKTSEKELSIFYAPLRRKARVAYNDLNTPKEVLNGIAIQRLKSKLGTRPLPTAELSLRGTRAHLIGKKGQGSKEMSTVLNITRIHNAVTACGFLGRGIAISRAFTRVRRVRGTLLMDIPAHIRTLAALHVEHHAYMQLTFFVVTLLGMVESENGRGKPTTPNQTKGQIPYLKGCDDVGILLRILTPVTKALTAKASVSGLAECMESLGGIGYLDSSSASDMETNIARLYRDANVLSIWEGTTQVMAEDAVRVLKGPLSTQALDQLDKWVKTQLQQASECIPSLTSGRIEETWNNLCNYIRLMNTEHLVIVGRDIAQQLGWIICAVLLYGDIRQGGDETSRLVAERWTEKRQHRTLAHTNITELVAQDKILAFGQEKPTRDAKL
ncbi:uncharacterized protein KY384_008187 [Bacidia gigantensis]|uniref:uncharacterized protein n=1 Tax=Bacidia gigantensis TaxID=2732470 RepID=UPI001D057003|nr:uncharacterized protein KY384_008187 [Bacidia gigantensis]KAG8526758.1 hypothetical protein KY384_008187 [Bacidia gigantensis]